MNDAVLEHYRVINMLPNHVCDYLPAPGSWSAVGFDVPTEGIMWPCEYDREWCMARETLVTSVYPHYVTAREGSQPFYGTLYHRSRALRPGPLSLAPCDTTWSIMWDTMQGDRRDVQHTAAGPQLHFIHCLVECCSRFRQRIWVALWCVNTWICETLRIIRK